MTIYLRRRSSWLSLFLMAIGWTIGCSENSTAPKTAKKKDQPAATKQPEAAESRVAESLPILISAEQLKNRLERSTPTDPLPTRILDARSADAYEAAHIPGAVRIDVAQWKEQALSAGGLHDAGAWSKLAGEVGVANPGYTIVYSDQPTNATRIWWTLKYLGVVNAALLDGGWPEWERLSGETTSEKREIPFAPYAVEFQANRLAEIDVLKTSHQSDDVAIIDTRSQDEYDKGRIPGAVRIEWSELLDDEGRFKSAEELRSLFTDRGYRGEQTAITYCQTGGRASLDAFALELAGFKRVKNYYCSWRQWSGDSEAPVEK